MELFWLFLLFVFVLWGVYKMPGYRAPAVSAREKTSDDIGDAFFNPVFDLNRTLQIRGTDFSDPGVREALGLDR